MIKDWIDALTKLSHALLEGNYTIGRYEGILGFEVHMSRTWNEFESLNSVERAQLRSIVDSTAATALLIYSMRMSMFAVRGRDERLLHSAVMALTVDNHVVDDQDALAKATLVYDAASRIGADPEALFRSAMNYATTERRNLFEAYLTGPSYLKSVRSMGYEAVETEFGFAYRLDFPGWPNTAGQVDDLMRRLHCKPDQSGSPDK